MHAARLGFQCLALLETKHLDLPIQDPAGSWLRTVRAGDVPFEEWLDRCVQLDRKLSSVSYTHLTLPTIYSV